MIAISDIWYRPAGSGHSFYFYATREEIANFLVGFFSKDIENYYVCGNDKLSLFSAPLENLHNILMQRCDDINFYVGCDSITPRKDLLKTYESNKIENSMILSGLILLQSFMIQTDFIKSRNGNPKSRISPSRFTQLSKIVRQDESGIYEHLNYYHIFNRIISSAKKTLTTYKTKDILTQNTDNRCFMSKGAVELYQQGVNFWHIPICPCPEDLRSE